MKFTKKTIVYKITKSTFVYGVGSTVVFYSGQKNIAKYFRARKIKDSRCWGWAVGLVDGKPQDHWNFGRSGFERIHATEPHSRLNLP